MIETQFEFGVEVLRRSTLYVKTNFPDPHVVKCFCKRADECKRSYLHSCCNLYDLLQTTRASRNRKDIDVWEKLWNTGCTDDFKKKNWFIENWIEFAKNN